MLMDVPPPWKHTIYLQMFLKRKQFWQNSNFTPHRQKMWRGKRHYRCCNTYRLSREDIFGESEEQYLKPNSTFTCGFVPLWVYSDPSSPGEHSIKYSKNSLPPCYFGLWRPWTVAVLTIWATLKSGEGVCSWNTWKEICCVSDGWQAWAALPLLFKLIYLHGSSARTAPVYTLLIFSARKNNTVLGI